MIFNSLNSYVIPEGAAVYRKPPRPPLEMQDNYENLFDYSTLFYDVSRCSAGSSVTAVGPPLLNLSAANLVIREINKDLPLRFTSFNHPLFSRICFDLNTYSQSCAISGDFGSNHVAISDDCSHLFTDKRVAMTVSKDNNLEWIADWALFNSIQHGANGVLFYDNSSTSYGLTDIERVLMQIPGLDVVVVVTWPFKWGPSGYKTKWDSNFAQVGAFEHARTRFLATAKSVLNSDVDELILTSTANTIFEEAERSPKGYVSFPGCWIENFVFDANLEWSARRYSDFVLLDGGIHDCPRKWAVVPAKSPLSCPWEPHRIPGMEEPDAQHEVAFYRHFRGISNGWKYKRDDVTCLGKFAVESDLPMVAAFKKTFKSR